MTSTLGLLFLIALDVTIQKCSITLIAQHCSCSLYGNWAAIFLWIHHLQLATVILQSQYISLAQSKEWRALWRKKDTTVTEKDEFHCTSTLQVPFIGIIFFFFFFKHKVFFKIHVIWLSLKSSCVQPACHYWHKLSGSELSYDYVLCKEDLFIDSSHIYLQGKFHRHR